MRSDLQWLVERYSDFDSNYECVWIFPHPALFFWTQSVSSQVSNQHKIKFSDHSNSDVINYFHLASMQLHLEEEGDAATLLILPLGDIWFCCCFWHRKMKERQRMTRREELVAGVLPWKGTKGYYIRWVLDRPLIFRGGPKLLLCNNNDNNTKQNNQICH